MSNGLASDMVNPSSGSDSDLGDNGYRGVNDVTVLRIGLDIPESVDCLQFNVQQLSSEYPEYVGSEYNDAFVAELDVNDWEVTNDTDISAPHNFALAPGDKMFSINSGLDWNPDYADGTPFNGATDLYVISSQITSGKHDLYLTVWDMGDNAVDTAVFLDNLHVYDSGGTCKTGVIPSDNIPPVLYLPDTIFVPQDNPGGAYVTYDAYGVDEEDDPKEYFEAVCDHGSGMTYPLGLTVVNCSTMDDAGNPASGNFSVYVIPTQTNIVLSSQFDTAKSYPRPWVLAGFRPPYGGGIECTHYLSGPCSLRLAASDRDLALSATQRINVPGGLSGDGYTFGGYSRAWNVPLSGTAYNISLIFYNGQRRVGMYTVNFNTGTHDFELASALVTAPANYTRIDIRINYQRRAGVTWYDDIFLSRLQN